VGRTHPLHIDPAIPINVVGPAQPAQSLLSLAVADESDRAGVPIPAGVLVERGGDAHMLILQSGLCRLFELYGARPQPGGWSAYSVAVFDLRSNALRPAGWTSADAAGLPVLAGLLRYEEVRAGDVRHALRITVRKTQRAYVWPARHFASRDTSRSLPPMGLRFRLRRDFDMRGYSPEARVILTALKRYGAIVADHGAPFFLTATPDDWPKSLLDELRSVRSESFEVPRASGLMVSPDSAQVASSGSHRK
jgi:hypothetical protein